MRALIIIYTTIFVFLFMPTLAIKVYPADTTLTQVTLQLKWKHQFQFAGYYAAIEKGYYRDVGLELILIEASDHNKPVEALINGSADFGISASDVVLMRAEGYPVVVLANIFQHSAQILLATESSEIKHVHDLVGKKLMIEPHSADLIAYMNDEGVLLNKVESVAHNFDVNLLIENKIDAMTAYITDEPFVLREHGIDYTIISPNAGGIDFYGDVLITTEQLIKTKPKLVENFRAATLKGWNYAMVNTDELVDIVYEKYSTRHSKEHLAFEAQKMQNIMKPDIIEIGYANLGRWQRIIEVYKETKMLDKDHDIKGLLYTDYLKKQKEIPWKLIGIFISIILFMGFVTLTFYKLTKKLKAEVAKSKQFQQTLIKSKNDLLESNKKLLSLSRFKEDMTHMIVHDLKAPLGSIINVKQMNNEDGLNLVQQSGYKMLNLIQNILGVYKYENTSMDLKKTEFRLVEIINTAIEEVKFPAEMYDVKIDINDRYKCHVNADADLINRVLVNLLLNAIKFAPEKTTIKVDATVNNLQEAEIHVINQGPSIPNDKQKRIFERFGQAESKNEGEMHSTGLGLTFCKMVVDAHKGKIGVDSEPGKAVDFWFTLPNGNCRECGGCTGMIANSLEFALTETEKSDLKQERINLRNYKVYQVSSINKIISKITSDSENIQNWIKSLEKAVYLGDEEKYMQLLK